MLTKQGLPDEDILIFNGRPAMASPFESLSLRKDQTKQEDVERHLFVFYTCGTSSLVEARCEKQKKLLCSFLRSAGLCKGPRGKREGKALSGVMQRHFFASRSSQSLSLRLIRRKRLKFFQPFFCSLTIPVYWAYCPKSSHAASLSVSNFGISLIGGCSLRKFY